MARRLTRIARERGGDSMGRIMKPIALSLSVSLPILLIAPLDGAEPLAHTGTVHGVSRLCRRPRGPGSARVQRPRRGEVPAAPSGRGPFSLAGGFPGRGQGPVLLSRPRRPDPFGGPSREPRPGRAARPRAASLRRRREALGALLRREDRAPRHRSRAPDPPQSG